jgi:hypothetical protein
MVLIEHGQLGFLLDKLCIGNSGVIRVVDQGRQYAGELGQRVRSDTVRMIVHHRCGVGISVIVVAIVGRNNDSREQLDNRHGHMRRMFIVVERIVPVGSVTLAKDG